MNPHDARPVVADGNRNIEITVGQFLRELLAPFEERGTITFDETGDAKVKTAYVKSVDNKTGTWVGGGSVTMDE